MTTSREAFANNLLESIERRRAGDGKQPPRRVSPAVPAPPPPVKTQKPSDIERRMRAALAALRTQD